MDGPHLTVPTGCHCHRGTTRVAPWSYPQNAKAFPTRRGCPWTHFTSRLWLQLQVVRPGPSPARRAAPRPRPRTNWCGGVTRGGVGSGTADAPTWHVAFAARTGPGPVSDGATEGNVFSLAAGLRHSICCFPTAPLTSLVLFQKFPELTRPFCI